MSYRSDIDPCPTCGSYHLCKCDEPSSGEDFRTYNSDSMTHGRFSSILDFMGSVIRFFGLVFAFCFVVAIVGGVLYLFINMVR